jgi:hypothetical protein
MKSKYAFVIHILICVLLTGSTVFAEELRDFTSDGCSLFPNGDFKDRYKWCDCCFSHDIAYWRGGTGEERKQADQELRQCVLERTGNKALAKMMYDGVRAGGHPAFATRYRWGYGWKYGRGYAPLMEMEERQVKEKLEAYRAKHPSGYCGEKKNNEL